MSKPHIDVVIPTCRSTQLVECVIKSFLKFGKNYNLHFYVIENSNFKDDNSFIESLGENIKVFNNQEDCSVFPYAGSMYNASACEFGLRESKSDLILFVHNDVVATSENWLDYLHSKMQDGYGAAAFIQDGTRIFALHISGILTTRKIAENINFRCRLDSKGVQILDVGDEITEYCRNNNLKTFVHKNTYNNPELRATIAPPFNKINAVRCLDDNGDVVFMHCARGTVKIRGAYTGSSASIEQWTKFVNEHLKLDLRKI